MKPKQRPTDPVTFGTLLRRARIAARLNQQQLADAVGVDISYVSKLENDRLASPAAKTIEAMAAALGVPAAEFLAAADKVPSTLGPLLKSPAARKFFGEAGATGPTAREWNHLAAELRRLRSADGAPDET